MRHFVQAKLHRSSTPLSAFRVSSSRVGSTQSYRLGLEFRRSASTNRTERTSNKDNSEFRKREGDRDFGRSDRRGSYDSGRKSQEDRNFRGSNERGSSIDNKRDFGRSNSPSRRSDDRDSRRRDDRDRRNFEDEEDRRDYRTRRDDRDYRDNRDRRDDRDSRRDDRDRRDNRDRDNRDRENRGDRNERDLRDRDSRRDSRDRDFRDNRNRDRNERDLRDRDSGNRDRRDSRDNRDRDRERDRDRGNRDRRDRDRDRGDRDRGDRDRREMRRTNDNYRKERNTSIEEDNYDEMPNITYESERGERSRRQWMENKKQAQRPAKDAKKESKGSQVKSGDKGAAKSGESKGKVKTKEASNTSEVKSGDKVKGSATAAFMKGALSERLDPKFSRHKQRIEEMDEEAEGMVEEEDDFGMEEEDIEVVSAQKKFNLKNLVEEEQIEYEEVEDMEELEEEAEAFEEEVEEEEVGALDGEEEVPESPLFEKQEGVDVQQLQVKKPFKTVKQLNRLDKTYRQTVEGVAYEEEEGVVSASEKKKKLKREELEEQIDKRGQQTADVLQAIALNAELKAKEREAKREHLWKLIDYVAHVLSQKKFFIADEVFEQAKKRGMANRLYNVYLKYCNRHHKTGFTEWLNKMEKDNVPYDETTYNELIRYHAEKSDVSRAQEFFEKMKSAGFSYDEKSYSALMIAHGKVQQFDTMVKLFDDMKNSGIEPTQHSYLTIIDAFASSGRVNDVMQWVETMKDAGFKETETYFYIQKAHATNGNIEETLNWFDKVKTVNKTNKMAWNLLVETYARKGYIAEAFHHLQIRKDNGVAPNSYTYVPLLEECAKRGDTEGIDRLFVMMKEAAFIPNLLMFESLFTILSKIPGKEVELEKYLQLMRKVKEKPTAQIYCNLLSAHARAGNERRVYQLFDVIVHVADEFPPSTFADICSVMKAPQKLVQIVRNLMQKFEMEVTPEVMDIIISTMARLQVKGNDAIELLTKLELESQLDNSELSAKSKDIIAAWKNNTEVPSEAAAAPSATATGSAAKDVKSEEAVEAKSNEQLTENSTTKSETSDANEQKQSPAVSTESAARPIDVASAKSERTNVSEATPSKQEQKKAEEISTDANKSSQVKQNIQVKDEVKSDAKADVKSAVNADVNAEVKGEEGVKTEGTAAAKTEAAKPSGAGAGKGDAKSKFSHFSALKEQQAKQKSPTSSTKLSSDNPAAQQRVSNANNTTQQLKQQQQSDSKSKENSQPKANNFKSK